ncbi:hypothetical protein [Povalibacter sp.]|uniref:hypothetical protein n=1 Tax=Povalibacter sp. TaxID=1962978 RepID=UPI002F401C35
MPRKRNPVGIAAGKLILAIQDEANPGKDVQDAVSTQKVMHRARTLLQASQSSSVLNLLDGRSVVEYLDPVWVEEHPAVQPSIAAFVATLSANGSV